MSKSVEQARRELFESWYAADMRKCTGFITTTSDIGRRRGAKGDYADYPCMHGKWLGFNGALDAVLIELPSDRSLSASDDPWYVLEQCRAAIEQTGLGIKTK